MNAVIYARYSSAGQTEQSIDGQLRVCNEFAERNGYKIVNEYIDRATTGMNDNRPAFLQMIDEAKSKDFQYIIVYKLDRFARNKYDSVFHKHNLNKLGIKVLSATEAISDTPEGRLVEGLLEMMAEMYSTDLSQKVKRGLKESYLKGNFTGGYILFGYKVENKKVLIDDETAPMIQYLFKEYASGKTLKDITNEINQMGYRTRNKKPFTPNSFQHCLTNKKYIGIHKIGDIENDNTYPTIIDEEIFNLVQKRLISNKKTAGKKKAKEEFLLTGKTFCGHCGANVVGISGTSKTKKKHSYYVCSKRYKDKTCNKNYENKGYLEWYVVEQAKDYILKPEIQEEVAKQVLEEFRKNINVKTITRYENKIEALNKEIDKCIDLMIASDDEIIIEKLKQKSKDLSIQKTDLTEQIKKLQIACKIKHKTKEDIIAHLKLFIRGNELDTDTQKRIIHTFINSVYIYDDKIIIYFNLFNIEQVSYIEMLENVEEIESEATIHDTDASVRILNAPLRQCTSNKNT